MEGSQELLRFLINSLFKRTLNQLLNFRSNAINVTKNLLENSLKEFPDVFFI